MKINNLKEKWWYRVLQVLFLVVLSFIIIGSVTVGVVYFIDNKRVDLENSYISCIGTDPIIDKFRFIDDAYFREELSTNYGYFYEYEYERILKSRCLNKEEDKYLDSLREPKNTQEISVLRVEFESYIDSIEKNYILDLDEDFSGSWPLLVGGVLLSITTLTSLLLLFRLIILYIITGKLKNKHE